MFQISTFAFHGLALALGLSDTYFFLERSDYELIIPCITCKSRVQYDLQ